MHHRIFPVRTVRNPLVFGSPSRTSRMLQLGTSPFLGAICSSATALVWRYVLLHCRSCEQGSGLRLRFAPGSCISFFTKGNFGSRILPLFVEGGSQNNPQEITIILPKMFIIPLSPGRGWWYAGQTFWVLAVLLRQQMLSQASGRSRNVA